MNKITGTIAAAVATIGVGYAVSNMAPVSSENDLYNSSVQIGKYCSGTVINDPDLSDGEQMTVISARHCLDSDQGVGTVLEINVPQIIGNLYSGDETIKVIVKDVSEKSDLILLQAIKEGEGLDLPKMDVYGGFPSFGDRVWALGFPAAETRVMTEGILGYLRDSLFYSDNVCVFDSVSCEYQEATTPIYPGSSGGGLFEWTNNGYQLVGVLTGMDIRMSFKSFWTPVEEIREFLNENGGS